MPLHYQDYFGIDQHAYTFKNYVLSHQGVYATHLFCTSQDDLDFMIQLNLYSRLKLIHFNDKNYEVEMNYIETCYMTFMNVCELCECSRIQNKLVSKIVLPCFYTKMQTDLHFSKASNLNASIYSTFLILVLKLALPQKIFLHAYHVFPHPKN